jgi:dipeptidyl aminopeptidase/acylaminoacyl peptidase
MQTPASLPSGASAGTPCSFDLWKAVPMMKRLALLLSTSLLLTACSTAPTHPSLTGSQQGSTSAPMVTPVSLPPLVPARLYVADWDGNGDYQISPDGKQLLWAARKGLNQGLFVKNLETGVVHSYSRPWLGRWAEDSRHILLEVHNGDENSSVVLLDSFEEDLALKNLTPFPGAFSNIQSTIDSSDDLLIASNKRDAKVFDLYRYRAATGALDLVAENPGTVVLWLTDRHGDLAGRARKDARQWTYENALPGDTSTQWREAFTAPLSDMVVPLQVADDHRFVWALSNRGRDKTALVKLDLGTGQEAVFYADPRVDVSHAFISRKRGEPLAVTLDPGAQEWKFFDAGLQALADQFKGPLASRMDVISVSRDENLIVASVQDSNGGRHLLVDAAKQQSTLLGELSSSRINAISPLPKQRPVAFSARDGLPLQGYLTTPTDANGLELRHAPTVVLVHGGPWTRDFLGLDNLPQFLANRGYAVLQVNYRGSSGYGKAFQEAAKGEFAGKMHTDLLDGVDYLVRQGITDPAKVAIMGASYGGYASLVGMTHTPGRFACGISLFGMSDISTLIGNAPPYWDLGLFQWHEYVGDPAKPEDLQRMRDKSPLYKVDQVQGPLLILQGARDARVHLDQATRMVEALQKAGKPVDFVLFPKAGHNLFRWIDRLTYYRNTEDFLAQCLGGRSNGYDFFELGSLIF